MKPFELLSLNELVALKEEDVVLYSRATPRQDIINKIVSAKRTLDVLNNDCKLHYVFSSGNKKV